MRRADELKSDVTRLEMSIMAAKAEYERIKEANLQVPVPRGAREVVYIFFHLLYHTLPHDDREQNLLRAFLHMPAFG